MKKNLIITITILISLLLFSSLTIAVSNPSEWSDCTIEEGKNALSNGYDIKKTSYYGKTALHFAIESNKFKVIKLLIDNGANLNSSIADKTPLEVACEEKRYKVLAYIFMN